MHVGGSSRSVSVDTPASIDVHKFVTCSVIDTSVWIPSGVGRAGPCLEPGMTIDDTVFYVYFVLYGTVKHRYVLVTVITSHAMHELLHPSAQDQSYQGHAAHIPSSRLSLFLPATPHS